MFLNFPFRFVIWGRCNAIPWRKFFVYFHEANVGGKINVTELRNSFVWRLSGNFAIRNSLSGILEKVFRVCRGPAFFCFLPLLSASSQILLITLMALIFFRLLLVLTPSLLHLPRLGSGNSDKHVRIIGILVNVYCLFDAICELLCICGLIHDWEDVSVLG